MRLLLANPRGFCAGVNRAIDCLKEAYEKLPMPIYVNHEIVHNSHVIKEFSKKGFIFVEDIELVPDDSYFIFNAHGVPKSLVNRASEKNLKVIDATCPLVNKVHLEVLKHLKHNRTIFLIGHENHSEVLGIMGYSKKNILLLSKIEDIDKFNVTGEVAYVTQTTLSIDDCLKIINALKKKYPHIIEPKKSNICYATTNRQNALKKIATLSDVVLIVGSNNSSNSNRLKEVAMLYGIKAYLIDSYTQIDNNWFKDAKVIGMSSGASTPEILFKQVVHYLEKIFPRIEKEEVIHLEEKVKFNSLKI